MKKLWLNRKNGVFIEDTCGLNECEHCPYEVEPPKEYCDCDARKVRCAIETFLEQRDDRDLPIYELTKEPEWSGYTPAAFHYDAATGKNVMTEEPAGKLFPAIKAFESDDPEQPMPEFEERKFRMLTYAAELKRIDLDYEPLADYPEFIVVGCRCEYDKRVDPLANAKNSEDEEDHYVLTHAPNTIICYDFRLGRPIRILWETLSEEAKEEKLKEAEKDEDLFAPNLCAPYLCELYREMFRLAAEVYGYDMPEDENGIIFRRCLLDSSSGGSTSPGDPYATVTAMAASAPLATASSDTYGGGGDFSSSDGGGAGGDAGGGGTGSDAGGGGTGGDDDITIDGVSCGPVYEPYGPVFAFMDTSEGKRDGNIRGYYIIDCSCNVHFLQHHPACKRSYWKAHIWPDACRCLDWRNVYLAYADELGITDFSWGSNTKYSYSYLCPDYESGSWKVCTGKEVWNLGSCYDGCDQYNYGYLDYTLLLAIRRDCKGQFWIGVIDKDAPFHTREYATPYLDMEFLGHVEPFSEDADLGFTWRCPIVVWHYWGSESPGYNCFDTETEASEYANDAGEQSLHVCGLANYYQGPMASKLDVSFPLKLIPGEVTYDEWNGQWCAQSGTWGAVDEGGYIINYLDTSRGFLVNGLEGYYASITIRGIRPYITPGCDGGEGQLYGHNHVPMDTTTLMASLKTLKGCEDEDGTPTPDLQDAWDLWRGEDPASPGERLPSDPFLPSSPQTFPEPEENTTP